MRKSVVIFSLVWGFLIPLGSNAQRDATWCFGDGIYMKFGPNGPVVDSTISTKYFFEMGASISDENGDLLMYVNGDSVFDKNGVGKLELPGKQVNYSITQGALILPSAVFTKALTAFIIHNCDPPSIYCFSKVEAKLNISNEITSSEIFLVDSLPTISQKQNAIRHANGKDWWILLHEVFGTRFHVVRINPFGETIVTPFNIGQNFTLSLETSAYGQMVINASGDRLAMVGGRTLSLYDFDRCTGVISNWITIDTVPWAEVYYGGSFSPDGTKFYASQVDDPNNLSPPSIFQFDLNSPDIPNSKTLIFSIPDTNYLSIGQHQLGPDGKIYITTNQVVFDGHPANFALSVINNPNAAGLACDFEYLKVPTYGKRLTLNLPNLPNYNLGPIASQTAECGPDTVYICAGDTAMLGHPDTTGGKCTYQWWPNTTISSTQTGNTTVWPTSTTTYYLMVDDTTSSSPCAVTEDSVIVRVLAPNEYPTANAGADGTLCRTDSLTLGTPDPSGGIWQYAWSPAAGLSDSTQAMPKASPNQSQTYMLTVTDLRITAQPGGCTTATDQVFIAVEMPLQIAPLIDMQECPGIPIELGNPAIAGLQYHWTPAIYLSDTTTAQPTFIRDTEGQTSYTLTVTDPAMQTRCGISFDTIMVTSRCLESGVSFFPNPTDGEVTLELRNTGSHTLSWVVYDAIGRRVRSGNRIFEGYLTTELGLETARAGVYWVRFQLDGVENTEKIVKLR